MGGRGSKSYSTHHRRGGAGSLPYNIASFDDQRGGAVYPFLEKTARAWRLLTRSVEAATDYQDAHTFGLSSPTLRWVNGESVNDLFVDGLNTASFLASAGLELDMHKGGFVLSKRLSRIMRPYRLQASFSADDAPAIAYMQQSESEAKVWDGAGIISRRMVQRMVLADDLSPRRREQLVAELAHAERVEFTLMSAKGQDKGHCMVADDLRDERGNPVDFLLPEDTKREVRLTDGSTFVGLNIVHGHDQMRLDIQSLINLHPFFDNEQLLSYLRDEGELFVESIQTGEVAAIMGKIDRFTTDEELLRWPLKEYLARGGHPLWFRAHVKGLLNQHLKRLNHQQLEKLRLPIPGGRHYVMPAAVGRRAGYELDVERGEIRIDSERSTAWVNDDDWLSLTDAADGSGIADILGGADNDDALWLHPFTDHDGERKVLAWRSPNQLGEYLLLKPTQRSADLPYPTAGGGFVRYPAADSRKLPQRIDRTETAYLNLIKAAVVSRETPQYTIDVMDEAIQQATANKGALGMYCNALLLNKALFGRLPDNPPAPLEEIIDGAVKTGDDLSAVVQWNFDNSRAILEQGVPLPPILATRLSIDRTDRENPPPQPRWTDDHWLAQLQQGIQTHIDWITQQRDELSRQARPPQALFDAIQEDEEALALGRGLNQTFAAVLNDRTDNLFDDRFDKARAAAESYLSHFPPEKQERILLGALFSVYTDDDALSDVVTWLAGSENSLWFKDTSVARRTIKAIGLLN